MKKTMRILLALMLALLMFWGDLAPIAAGSGTVTSAQAEILAKNKKKKAFYADSYEELFSHLSTTDKNFTLLFVGAGDLPQLLHKNGFLS